MRFFAACSPVMILLSIAAVGLAADQPASTPLSTCFPPDTFLYAECPSVPDIVQGAKTTGLYGLWNDPAMNAIRASVEGHADGEAAATGDASVLRTFKDFASGLPGAVAVGLVPSASGVQWLAIAEIGPDPAAARAFLDRVYAEETRAGHATSQIQIAEVTATVSGVDGECSAIINEFLLFGTGEAFSGAVQRLGGDSGASSLSTSPSFIRATSFLSARPAYRIVIDLPTVLSLLKKAVGPRSPVDIDALTERLGVDDIDTVSIEGRFQLSGVLERCCISTRSADSRLIDLAGRGRFDESRLDLVPIGALFCGGQAGDAKLTYETWKGIFETLGGAAGVDVEAAVTSLEDKAGVSVEKDILPSLGSMSIGYLLLEETTPANGPSFGGGFRQVTLIEVKDESALSQALDKVAAYAKLNPSLLAPLVPQGAPPPTVETSTLGTLKIIYLSTPGVPFSSPALAVYKGYLVYANNKDTVKDAIDILIAPGTSILESEDFARVRGALAKPSAQLAYVSLDRVIDLVYVNLLPLVSHSLDQAQARGDSAVSSADIPPAHVVKRYVDGIGVSTAASGNLITVEVYSPTGMAPLAAPVLLAVAGRTAAAAPAALQARTNSPRARLAEIGRLLQVSTMDRRGRFPDKITDVVPAELLRAPQAAAPPAGDDYIYVPGLTLDSPGGRVLVYERQGLNPDGRYILYKDGRVEFVSEKDFQEIIGREPK